MTEGKTVHVKVIHLGLEWGSIGIRTRASIGIGICRMTQQDIENWNVAHLEIDLNGNGIWNASHVSCVSGVLQICELGISKSGFGNSPRFWRVDEVAVSCEGVTARMYASFLSGVHVCTLQFVVLQAFSAALVSLQGHFVGDFATETSLLRVFQLRCNDGQ